MADYATATQEKHRLKAQFSRISEVALQSDNEAMDNASNNNPGLPEETQLWSKNLRLPRL